LQKYSPSTIPPRNNLPCPVPTSTGRSSTAHRKNYLLHPWVSVASFPSQWTCYRMQAHHSSSLHVGRRAPKPAKEINPGYLPARPTRLIQTNQRSSFPTACPRFNSGNPGTWMRSFILSPWQVRTWTTWPCAAAVARSHMVGTQADLPSGARTFRPRADGFSTGLN
jgi:hypothetical protein